jgi:hypothetical protein
LIFLIDHDPPDAPPAVSVPPSPLFPEPGLISVITRCAPKFNSALLLEFAIEPPFKMKSIFRMAKGRLNGTANSERAGVDAPRTANIGNSGVRQVERDSGRLE